jgi:hypothetical protein
MDSMTTLRRKHWTNMARSLALAAVLAGAGSVAAHATSPHYGHMNHGVIHYSNNGGTQNENQSSSGSQGENLYTNTNTNTDSVTRGDVDTASLPEPGTLALLLAGAAGLLLIQLRRRASARSDAGHASE